MIVGFDIGGTKCAALVAEEAEGELRFLAREEFPTAGTWQETLEKLAKLSQKQLAELGLTAKDVSCGGISCGGPLNAKRGVILSPPNLKGWDEVPATQFLSQKMGFPVRLKNDADACAVAEWKYGAGKGCDNMIFLTFGTGIGAGLILNGKLYEGGCSMAGEIGHMRLSDYGPVGYGKRGSFEGFCSGNGIAQQAETARAEFAQQGCLPPLFQTEKALTAKDIFTAADGGDPVALELLHEVGERFGKGLSVLIDVLNPDVIVCGGIYMRGRRHIDEAMVRVLERECLAPSLAHVKILPAALGERIGDYGAVMAALEI